MAGGSLIGGGQTTRALNTAPDTAPRTKGFGIKIGGSGFSHGLAALSPAWVSHWILAGISMPEQLIGGDIMSRSTRIPRAELTGLSARWSSECPARCSARCPSRSG